ncbi:hypothetical protein BCR33DRAFT_718763 [Rhizoclosmatium globosum]|uniref:Uncharacterized protein n=1 Tax=Rhizoclosmatium globosum TaxID=329046 RepID=A0A1Y2C3Y9_9FUNG|nr:hypothetical protein BCR33DRAFT_718763 [Rhizoclosmatium globosum]|eukprot:ORY41604.1 hypothetical protein BCR33DRAFT_718763 [Rhizoclosmatium globosum]
MSVAALPEGTKGDEAGRGQNSSEEWLLLRIGVVPRNSLGWFRCGVDSTTRKSTRKLSNASKRYNAFQIMARACIAVNRKDDAIAALKQSVMLDNPSDWQLLVELTSNTV